MEIGDRACVIVSNPRRFVQVEIIGNLNGVLIMHPINPKDDYGACNTPMSAGIATKYGVDDSYIGCKFGYYYKIMKNSVDGDFVPPTSIRKKNE